LGMQAKLAVFSMCARDAWPDPSAVGNGSVFSMCGGIGVVINGN